MIDLKFEIQGLEKLKIALRRAPELTLNEISKAVKKSALTVQSHAMKEAPVNKQTGGGNLRQRIKVETKSKTRSEIISKAPYSIFVEAGTSPHLIRPKIKKGLANRRTGQYFGKLVHHPGTQANPFMRRALERSMADINNFFREAIKNIFDTFWIK